MGLSDAFQDPAEVNIINKQRDRDETVNQCDDHTERTQTSNASTTAVTQSADPPTMLSPRLAATTSLYPWKFSTALMGDDELTEALIRWGYFRRAYGVREADIEKPMLQAFQDSFHRK